MTAKISLKCKMIVILCILTRRSNEHTVGVNYLYGWQVEDKEKGKIVPAYVIVDKKKEVPSLCDRERTITWLWIPRFHTHV